MVAKCSDRNDISGDLLGAWWQKPDGILVGVSEYGCLGWLSHVGNMIGPYIVIMADFIKAHVFLGAIV